MSDNTFDLEILSAWTTFETHLARYISVMEDDDTLVVESHYDSMDELADAPACIQFFAWNQTSVRCEVPSNRFLHPLRMLEPEDHSALLDMGFNAPDLCEHEPEGNGSMSFYIDVDRARPEELVTKVLRVFREMWSIAHPVVPACQHQWARVDAGVRHDAVSRSLGFGRHAADPGRRGRRAPSRSSAQA